MKTGKITTDSNSLLSQATQVSYVIMGPIIIPLKNLTDQNRLIIKKTHFTYTLLLV